MNYIFKPSHIFTNDPQHQDEKLELFTIVGHEDYTDENGYPCTRTENQYTYAKKITRTDGSAKYTIRIGADKKLYNPVSPIDKMSNSLFLDRVSRSNTKFRSVNQKTFEWYLQFLTTKNISWLHNAEREAE